jgi:hypothetical protein
MIKDMRGRIIALAMAGMLFPSVAVASIGFIQGNIWYSKDPFFDGDSVRIYSGVFNNTPGDIVGSVSFFDNGSLLHVADFSVTGGGHLREVWADWQASAGKHTITAQITKAVISRAGKPDEPAEIGTGGSGVSERDVDVDTDHDGIGNAQDADDDNDGVSDADEITRGTDPLRADQPTKSVPSSGESFGQAGVVAQQALAQAQGTLDNFAVNWAQSLSSAKESLRQKIATIEQKEKTFVPTREGERINEVLRDSGSGADGELYGKPQATVGEVAKKFGFKFLLLIVTVLHWIVTHPIALYITALILLSYVLKLVWRFVSSRFHRRRDVV